MNIENLQPTDLSKFVPEVHFELIRIRDLVSNQTYQRNLSISHIESTADDFNIYQINTVKVSRRNGINYVFDGQHTIEIIAKVSGSRDTPVWCMIYDDLNYEEEADIFANQQKHSKNLTPYEIFMASLESGSEKHLIIKTIVESYHLTLAPGYLRDGICALSTLENIYDSLGMKVLDRVIGLIIQTWNGEKHSLSANMLKGLSKIISVYGDDFEDEMFIEKCGKVSVKELGRLAKDRRGGSLGYAEAMLIYYNKRNKYTLPFEKLYTKRNNIKPFPIEEEINEDLESESLENVI